MLADKIGFLLLNIRHYGMLFPSNFVVTYMLTETEMERTHGNRNGRTATTIRLRNNGNVMMETRHNIT